MCCALQEQALHKKDKQKMQVQMSALRTMNPKQLGARAFREEYDKVIAENASLKTAAAGNEEVWMAVHHAWVLARIVTQDGVENHVSMLRRQSAGHQSNFISSHSSARRVCCGLLKDTR